MQSLGLTAVERRAFEQALCKPHTRRISVSVLDLDGKVLASLTPVLIDGQVVVDYDAEISRAASLTFLDPAHAMSFDTDSPDDGALYADRMIQINYAVHVEALGRYVSTRIFVGPVTKMDRAGDVVNIEAQGKETIAQGAIWATLSFPGSTRVSDAIRTLMLDRAGETHYTLPAVSTKLPSKGLSLDRYADLWATAKKLARTINRQLYYDGSGKLILRTFPGTPVYTFRSGKDGNVVADVEVSYELDNLKNYIIVLGALPKGAKQRIRATAKPSDNHPLSPKRLGRTGHPRYLVETIEDDSITSAKEAQARADAVLANRLRETVDVTFDALPVPHLDPGDLVSISTSDFSSTFRLRRFSIPLGTSDDSVMSVGYLKRTTLTLKRFRKK